LADYIYKRQAIDDLVPGMTLGKMIVTTDGKNFLNEGAVLTLRIIQTLQLWGFRYVDIREECPPDWHVDGKSLATPLETPIESTPVLTETELRDKTSGPQLSLNETEARGVVSA